jgi:hypothetical protein
VFVVQKKKTIPRMAKIKAKTLMEILIFGI